MTYIFTELQEAWLHDLETTDERFHGTGTLTRREDPEKGTPEQDCCLGRGCKVVIRSGVDLLITDGHFNDLTYDESGDLVPPRVRFLLGFKEGAVVALVNMNDGSRLTFRQIAKEIREHPERFFEDAAK